MRAFALSLLFLFCSTVAAQMPASQHHAADPADNKNSDRFESRPDSIDSRTDAGRCHIEFRSGLGPYLYAG